MKILVISLAGIGDTLLATPLIHELRANYPEARIDALVLWAGSKDILEGNPHLNRVFQRNLMKEGKLASLRFLRSVAKERFDLSINTHPQSRIQYRGVARLVGAPVRISHLYECCGWVDRLLVNRTLAQDYARHTVDNNLDILPLLGKKPLLPRHELEVFLAPADHQWADAFVAENRLGGRARLGIHVGSGGTKNLTLKRWPWESYRELLRRLKQSAPDLAVLLFGGPEEDPELQRLMAEVDWPGLIRVRSRGLRQAGALLQRLNAFLSVDTALMHLASAVKAPGQIVIEAFTLNQTNQPYGHPFTLVPNPAVAGRHLDFYRYDGRDIKGTREELIRCMASVSVDAVHAAVLRTLKQ